MVRRGGREGCPQPTGGRDEVVLCTRHLAPRSWQRWKPRTQRRLAPTTRALTSGPQIRVVNKERVMLGAGFVEEEEEGGKGRLF